MRCKECDSLLWSDASKKLGVCPECNEGEDRLSEMATLDPENIIENERFLNDMYFAYPQEDEDAQRRWR